MFNCFRKAKKINTCIRYLNKELSSKIIRWKDIGRWKERELFFKEYSCNIFIFINKSLQLYYISLFIYMYNSLPLKIYCTFHEEKKFDYLFAVHSYSGNSNYANSCYGHWMTDIRLVVIPVTSYEVTAVSQRVTSPASVTALTTAAMMKLTRRRWPPCRVSSRTPHCSSISARGAGLSVCPQG